MSVQLNTGGRFTGRALSYFFYLACVIFCASSVYGADAKPILVWPEGAPGSESWTQQEAEIEGLGGQQVVHNVVQPTLIPYLADPKNNTGISVIIAPGGGFKFLAINQEGTEVAAWLNQRGINAFVLKYRLDETTGNPSLFNWQIGWMFVKAMFRSGKDFPQDVMSPVQNLAISDGVQAIKTVRANAKSWGLREDAIGILGFSAGGAVSSGTALRGHGAARPDFAASIYGVIVTDDVPKNAPPLFLLAAEDDPLVPMIWSETMAKNWRAAGYDSKLVSYKEGGHGFGMKQQGLASDDWINRFYDWLLLSAEK